jgi:hypothetical protein
VSAPNPDVIQRLVNDTRAKLLTVTVDYGFLYSSAWEKPRGGDGGERVATHAEPDLSDLMMGDVATIRRYIEESAAELFKAHRQVQVAEARLNDVASMLDRRKPVVPEVANERAIDRPADAGDIGRARKAQVRRRDRANRRVLPWSKDETTG